MTFKFISFCTIWASLLIGFILIPLTGWAQTPIPIECGQPVMGSFNTPGQKNSYSFTGTAGDHVSIFVEEPGNMTFLPTIRLFDPYGEEIREAFFVLHETLPVSGVYRVDVTFSSVEAGNYLLVWQRWNNPCGATNINCGQVVKASVGGTVDVPPWRFYSFGGLAGDRVTIFGSGLPLMRAKDSQGNLLGSSYDRLDITLPASGTYHFWIMSTTDQGDYFVRWQRWNNPCNATPLSCGQPISASFKASGQHDYYTFNVSTGDELNINLTRTSGSMIPYLQLIDFTGTQIGFNFGFVGSASIEKMLSTGGIYIIEVSDDGDNEVGSYKLKVQKNNNSCPEVVLTAPNGSEILESGSNCTITWTSASPGGISSQEIRLSKDGGQTFPTIIATGLPGNAQSFNWTIPTDIATPRGRIRVTIIDASGSVYDDSDADFIILQYVPKVSRTYVYDKVNQLIQVIYEDGSSIHYSYDAVGNRIALTGASQSEGVLSVTPSEGLSSSGNQGGPFNPSTKDYVLENRGGGPVDYTVNKAQPWITLSGTSGSIAAGASTTITVSVNSNANALTGGSYTDTVGFTNTTNGIGNTTRNVSLTVSATSETITAPASPSGPNSGNTGTNYTYSTGSSSSSLGHNVQYLFDWRDGTDSGWLPVGQNSASKIWTSVGTFNIRVQARCATDTSVVSPWSGFLSVNITTVDIFPPAPNPMTWATPPYQTGSNSISMVATTASDPVTPITYYFEFMGSSTGGTGGTHSNWQAGTSHTNFGLEANHQYGYRVRAKDGVNNETGYSVPTQYVYTAIEATTGITFATVTPTSIQAQSINTPSGLNRGSSGLLIENTTNSSNSGWKQDNSFWTSNLLTPNTSYSFRAKVRNGDAMETGYSPVASKYTLANVPGSASFSNISQTCIRANWTANGNPAGTQFFSENQTLGTNSGWITETSWNSCALSFGTLYSFRVKAKNADGIETDWTSLGSQSAVAYAYPFPFFDDFSTDKGWMGYGSEGWERGSAKVGGGETGYLDPSKDYSENIDNSILGFAIGADYPNDLSEESSIVSPPVDCTGKDNVFLKFRRHLNVEGNKYDHARIYISVNGIEWTEVWKNPVIDLIDSQWVPVVLDISSIAANQGTVYIKFTMGPTNSSRRFSGWNIDDLEVTSEAIYPSEGTYGTELMMTGSGFGSKKGKVLMGGTSLSVLEWADHLVRLRLTKVLPLGLHDVMVQPAEPKGAPSVVKREGFIVRPPEIHFIEEEEGTAYDEITIKGKLFGTKKGKVYLKYGEDSKSCKVTKWWMDPVTNESEIFFIVPKMLPGVCDVVVDPVSPLPDAEKAGGFTVKAPEIESVDPGSGSVGEQITISGNFFGSKTPKVYLGYLSKGKQTNKSCSILSWSDDEIVFTVPTLPVGSYDVIVTNGVGSDTLPGGFVIK
jgi:YD repeat-containing protein